MPELNETKGLAYSIGAIKKIYDFTDEQLEEILGDSVFAAMMQNNYGFVTIKDMMNLADALGLVFVINFQSLDVYNAEPTE